VANQGGALMWDSVPGPSLSGMSYLECIFIVVSLVAGLWWALARHRRPNVLQRVSVVAVTLAAITLIAGDPHWQMVPWQVLAFVVATAAALRRWRPGGSRRWHRVVGRVAMGAGLLIGSAAILTAFVPTLPAPTGPHHVGSEIFRWTDSSRPETLTPDRDDRRQVVVQAWYPTDTTQGRPVPYFEAQDRLPGSVGGLPSFMFASFGEVDTHATFEPPVSSARTSWPVLLFSPGLGVPREEYTALSTELASRGYVVVAMSAPYESSPTVLAGGRVVGQTQHPNVMGPAPHPELERLIDIRTADASFVLDKLHALDPKSPLADHLDLARVGIVGHSMGGATAVQAMEADHRFKVGVDLDGKLFGREPDARLDQPLLWIQSGDAKDKEYTRTRDRRLRDGGTLMTIAGSSHMGFSDAPSYMTAAGRSVLGGVLGSGSLSVGEMTPKTADAITAFVAPVFARAEGGAGRAAAGPWFKGTLSKVQGRALMSSGAAATTLEHMLTPVVKEVPSRRTKQDPPRSA
jgi:predicted dienelactone hydrolase